MKKITTTIFLFLITCVCSYSQESGVIIESISGGGHYCIGQEIVLLCKASGTNLTYQWKKDEENIEGEHSPNLIINSAEYDNSGVYSCYVSNSSDSSLSSGVLVYIDNSTSIIEQPQNTYTLIGCQVSFEVKANTVNTDDFNSTYQWYKDREILSDSVGKYSGTNTSILTISNTNPLDTLPKYWCKINGLCGSIESQKAGFDFLKIRITYRTPNDTACIGEKRTLKIVVETNANAKLYYQWYYDYQPIWRANSTEYTIDSMTDNNWGYFHCLISDKNFNFKLSSDTIKLYIDSKPTIVQEYQRDNYKFPVGREVGHLYVYAQGFNRGTLNYKWFKNGAEYQSLYKTVLYFRRIQLSDEGEYYCIVSNHCGADTSKKVRIRVIPIGIAPDDEGARVSGYVLTPPKPNPVNTNTTIKYYLPKDGIIKITLRDLYGNELSVLIDEFKESGTHELFLEEIISELYPGTYFYTLEADNVFITNKMTIIR